MRWGLLWLQSSLLAVLLTWPLASVVTQAAIGSPAGDVAKHLWTLWWMRREVWDGVPGLRTTWVGWPDGMALWPIEPLDGLAAALVPLGPVALSNVLALVHLTLVGVCTGWLGWRVGRRPEAAHVAGLVAQGSSFAAFTLALGAGELRALWIVPLGLGFLWAAHERGGWRWFAAFGGVLGLGTVSCFYYGLFLALSSLAVVAASPRSLRAHPAGHALAAVLAVVLALAPVRLFSTSYDPAREAPAASLSEWVLDPASTPHLDDANDAVNLDQLLVPARGARATATAASRAYNGGRYLGLVTLLLAALGVAADPRRALPLLAVGAVGLVLASGNVVMAHGLAVEVGEGRLGLPLAWLNRALAFYAQPINFPARFLAPTTIALAVLAGLATRRRWTVALAPLALLDVLANDLVEWPRPVFRLPDVTGLSPVEGGGAVANLTPFVWKGGPPIDLHSHSALWHKDAESRTRAIAAQLALDAPFEIAPIERLDHWYPDGLLWVEALPVVAALADPPRTPLDVRADRWLLHQEGFDRILLTFSPESGLPSEIERMMTAAFGEPVRSSCASVWSVPDYAASPEEARLWRDGHRWRLTHLPRPQFLPPLRDSVTRLPAVPRPVPPPP